MYLRLILTCYLVIPYPFKKFTWLSLKYCFWLSTELDIKDLSFEPQNETSVIFFPKQTRKQTNKKVGQGEKEILIFEIHVPFNSLPMQLSTTSSQL